MYERQAALSVVLTTVVALACATNRYSASVMTDVNRLRAATNAFHSLDSAVAAGYPRQVPACIVHEHHGAMGFHHLNRALLNAAADVEHPEILLYEQRPDGSYQLNGSEFIIPYRFYPRDSVPPILFGQQMKQEDNLKYWYLHVWAWKDNPNGLFADFHPDVFCAADSTRREYVPSYEKKAP